MAVAVVAVNRKACFSHDVAQLVDIRPLHAAPFFFVVLCFSRGNSARSPVLHGRPDADHDGPQDPAPPPAEQRRNRRVTVMLGGSPRRTQECTRKNRSHDDRDGPKTRGVSEPVFWGSSCLSWRSIRCHQVLDIPPLHGATSFSFFVIPCVSRGNSATSPVLHGRPDGDLAQPPRSDVVRVVGCPGALRRSRRARDPGRPRCGRRRSRGEETRRNTRRGDNNRQ